MIIDYRWARTSLELSDSLVYVSKNKSHGERYVLVHTVEVLIPRSSSLIQRLALLMSPDAGLSIIYGLKLSFEWVRPLEPFPNNCKV